MARVKYFNPNTGKWEYADSCFAVGGNDSGGNVAYDEAQNLTEEQKAQARENIGAQPKGNYLTEHQSLEGYAKTTDIPTKPEDIGAQPAGNYLTEVPEGYAKTEDIPTDEHIIDLIEENAPESSGGGIAVTGAKVGQTVKISAVDENGVPTAWTAVDFPSGGSSGGDNAFKFLGSTEPTTELVNRIDLSIEVDGITEIIVRGVAKQGVDEDNGRLSMYINNQIASANAPISTNYESIFHYQAILTSNRCFYNLRASQWGNGALTCAFQDWSNRYGEQVKIVGLQQSNWQNFALGTYFEVWGR